MKTLSLFVFLLIQISYPSENNNNKALLLLFSTNQDELAARAKLYKKTLALKIKNLLLDLDKEQVEETKIKKEQEKK
jgi:hypothetical protein